MISVEFTVMDRKRQEKPGKVVNKQVNKMLKQRSTNSGKDKII